MRERGVLWVVLAGMVAGLVGIAAVAASGGSDRPARLPVLAIGGAAGGGAESKMAASDSMLMPVRPVQYRVAGDLPALDDHARAWHVGSAVSKDDIVRLADALGLDGAKVTRDGDSWTAATDDRQLRVESGAGLPWYLGPAPMCGPVAKSMPAESPASSEPPRELTAEEACAMASSGTVSSSGGAATAGTGSPTGAGEPTQPCGSPCPDGAKCSTPPCQTRPEPGTTEPAPDPGDRPSQPEQSCDMPPCPPGQACIQMCPRPAPMPVPAPEPQRRADLPTKADAEQLGRSFLARAGLDLASASVRVDDGFSQWVVAADPTVGGLPTIGLTWSVGIGPRGRVEFAGGYLADPTKGDDYPLVGMQAALERLQANPYGGFGWSPDPEPMIAAADAPTCEGCPSTEPQVRTIVGVRLGLLFAPVFAADGPPREAVLVPAYLFQTDEEHDATGPPPEVPLIAVADEFLPKPPPDQSPPRGTDDTVIVEKQ